jgi:putative transposase
MIDQAVTELAPWLGTVGACQSVGASRASLYRWRTPPPQRPSRARTPSARALSALERQTVLDRLHEDRFADCSPAHVYATLLDEGSYLASERTMYRLLAAQGEVHERRDQLTHPAYARPELLASAPNEVWSWDITKLLGPAGRTPFVGPPRVRVWWI